MGDLKVTGVKELQAALGSLPGRLQRQVVAPAIAAALEPIGREAQSNAPVRSGRLRRALKVVMGRVRPGVVAGDVGVRQGDLGKAYAGPAELGAKGRKGRHFLQKAFDHLKASAKRELETKIAKGLEDLASR